MLGPVTLKCALYLRVCLTTIIHITDSPMERTSLVVGLSRVENRIGIQKKRRGSVKH